MYFVGEETQMEVILLCVVKFLFTYVYYLFYLYLYPLRKSILTHSFPMHLFSTTWKNEKNLRFF